VFILSIKDGARAFQIGNFHEKEALVGNLLLKENVSREYFKRNKFNKINQCWLFEKKLLGGVFNPNSFGGFLTLFSLFVNNCRQNFEQTMFDRSFI